MPLDWPLVLCYHHLDETGSSRHVVSARVFGRQLARMLEGGWTPLSLSEAIDGGPFGTRDAPSRSFTITFDDGFASFHDLAFPILERLGLASATTMFVPTAYVGGTASWSDDATLAQPLMSWKDIAELAEAGVAFGSHGHEHLPMQELTYDEALADVRTSLGLLEGNGITARYFALPYGWHSEECKRAIRDAGIDAAFSVKWGGHDRYEIRRIPVYGTDSGLTHRMKLSGRYFDAFDTVARLAGKERHTR